MQTSVSLDALLLRPLVFTQPMRLVQPTSWVPHVPFAFWLIDALRPTTVVELGTQSGNSYAALAQAVQTAGLDTACYAVDTWQGDHQAGLYGEEVFEEWSRFHDGHFSAFSRLVRATFDEARTSFPDRSVDLLHIDGLHTYEAVRHDFTSWLPKVSDRGVVMLHDINVRERDFGVWRFWEELARDYPTFSFLHAHGLGIVAVGAELPRDVRCLVSELPDQPDRATVVRRFFASLGTNLEQRAQLAASLDAERAQLSAAVSASAQLEQTVLALRAHAERLDAALQASAHGLEDRARTLEEEAAARSEALETEATRLRETLEASAHALEDSARALAEEAARSEELAIESTRLRETLDQLEHENSRGDAVETSLRAELAAAQRDGQVARSSLAWVAREIEPLRAGRSQGWTKPLRVVFGAPLVSLVDIRHPRGAIGLVRLLARPRLVGHLRRVALSHLFDEPYYRARYPDVPASHMPALVHFVLAGAREGRSPHPLFDGSFYLAQNADVRQRVSNPLVHYLLTGAAEGRDPHPLFSTTYYLRQNPHVAPLAINPLVHFLAMAGDNLRSPHPLFDVQFYLEQNAEACRSGANPLAHFVERGAAEELSPHPLFDCRFYLQRYADVRASGMNPLAHYLEHVPGEDRDPHPLFDSSYYLDRAPDLVRSGVNPLAHFVDHGWREGRRPNPYFDPLWYMASNPDVAASGRNPLEHFARIGWREGRDPSREFSTADYIEAYPDIAAAGTNPLAHYLAVGLAEGREARTSRSRQPLPASPRLTMRVHGSATEGADAPAQTVVFVSHVVPYPPRAGNEYRSLRLLEWLVAQGYRVLLVLAPLPGQEVSEAQMQELVRLVGNVAVCTRDGGVRYVLRSCPDVLAELDGRRTRAYAYLLGERAIGTPRERELLAVDRAFCHDALLETVLHALDRLERPVLLVQYVWMMRLLTLAQGTVPTILDTLDVYSAKTANVVSYGIDDFPLSEREEASRLARADLTLAIQDRDREALQRLETRSDVITTGVNFEVRRPASAPEGPVVLMIASGNAMNRLGLADFLRFAWPSILARVPDARLVVAGGVSDEVPEDAPGVEVLGQIGELAPLYARCRVVINPAVAGTGLKIKTVEALSHVRPIVTWPNGLEGIPDDIQSAMLPVGDWLEFGNAVVRHLECETALDDQTEQAIRTFLSPQHAYGALAERLARMFDRRVIPMAAGVEERP